MDLASFQNQEVDYYCAFINEKFVTFTDASLKSPELKSHFPLNESNFFENLKSGIVFGFLLTSLIDPDSVILLSIDSSISPSNLASHNVNDLLNNMESVIVTAKLTIGIPFSINAIDLVSGRKQSILDFTWYIIRRHFLAKVNLGKNPLFMAYLLTVKTTEEILQIHNESLLISWCNWVITKSNLPSITVRNFSSDFTDGVVLHILAMRSINSGFSLGDAKPVDFVHNALCIAREIGCATHILEDYVISGHPRLIMTMLCEFFEKDGDKSATINTVMEQLDAANIKLSVYENEAGKRKALEEAVPIFSVDLATTQSQIEEYEKLIVSLKRDFEVYKEDTQAELSDLIESTRESEKKLHESTIFSLLATESCLKKRLIEMISSLRHVLSDAEGENDVLSAIQKLSKQCSDSNAIELLDTTDNFIGVLSRRYASLTKEVSFLRESARNSSLIDDRVESRVREFASRSASINSLG